MSLKYQNLSEIDWVLKRPDTFAGSLKPKTREEYVANLKKIYKKRIKSSDALVCIFVEALSNVIDNVWRSQEYRIPCTKIRVEIDKITGKTMVWNDGLHIPIKKNKKGVYIPEMIFGTLRSSSNYNDNEERKTSGRNGLGIKLTNIFSKSFSIEIGDPSTKQLYRQTWTDNMKVKSIPIITKYKNKRGFTRVTWVPDFERFKYKSYTSSLLDLYLRKIYNMAMIIKIPVEYNDNSIRFNTLETYAQMYRQKSTEKIQLFNTSDSEVVLMENECGNGFEFVAFTNGVENPEGGVHVDAWSEAIFRPIVNRINVPKKPKITIKDVKKFFRLFVVCNISNPTFNSQTKARLESPEIMVKVSASGLKNILKWSVMGQIKDIIKGKELVELRKATSSKKGSKFKHIDNYDRANNSGKGMKARECTLIICEGLSAKTYAVKGINEGVHGKSGRDWFGIFPIKGKLLNVRNASGSKISNCKEVMGIIAAMNLKSNVDYTLERNFKTLNYGKVMIIADADVDGIHIGGLLINMFYYLYPTLFQRNESIIESMQTPIATVSIGRIERSFYNQTNFDNFQKQNIDNPFKATYFKGLGTSDDKQVKKTFGKKIIKFKTDDDTDDIISLAFDKNRSNNRKEWLRKANPGYALSDMDGIEDMNIKDFVNSELIKFSLRDCERSIPNLYDGFKESQRKILFTCILKKLTNKKLKVAQLAGSVAENTHYHHGEQCLLDTIVKMAQAFPGSNNIPLLQRDGQFGSRLEGGKDAASGRYLFTQLEKLTRLIFPEVDDPILNSLIEEGDRIEPEYYVPIIPMILANGVTAAIGTGWSSSIPCFNPLDLVRAVKNWIDGAKIEELVPWYTNYSGKMVKDGKDYISYGRTTRDRNKVIIDELPIGKWINKFKDELEMLLEKKHISKLRNLSDADAPYFEVEEIPGGVRCEDALNLSRKLKFSNMVLFTEPGKIKKFESVEEIIDMFCEKRNDLYKLRKKHQLKNLKNDYRRHSNRYKFLKEVMDETLLIFRRPTRDIIKDLNKKEYLKFDGTYEYLLSMPIRNFSQELLAKIKQQIDEIKKSYNTLNKTKTRDIWISELNAFEKVYKQWLINEEKEFNIARSKATKDRR